MASEEIAMTKQVTLENTRAGGFGLPTGQVVPGNGSIVVEPEIWEAAKDHPVVKAMVDGGHLIVDGKGKKKYSAGDERDENGDTAEMAEMRRRFDASFAAVTTELQAEKAKVADLEAQLAKVNQGNGEPKSAADVLALADGNFMAFKSAASKLLGDKTPSKKDEIVAALEELATS
ncbi:hypothetical protein [Aminobacter sp. MDW-2]|uniref:hypothetical protein n=1 Tax=Aminobacter sp. MDW-2 TaxID=2666139 RepID=UPI0012B00324|nr:hypothetical protein [Aminobacter sp. MDW-2]MRX33215.1 hypothetical protein [Aminobacter sp. MDW-2]QNH37379.1 hypothetical protein H5P29_13590 [Aminobacter sp. MDW-2]